MLKSLEQILIEKGLVTKEQLEQATQDALLANTPLSTYLVAQKLVSEEHIAQAYAEQLGVAYIATVTEGMADQNLLAQVPLTFLRQNSIMPVIYQGKTFILTADPMDYQAIDELNMLLGGGFPIALVSQTILIDAINRYYPIEGPKKMIEELGEEKPGESFEFGNIEEKDILGMAQEAPIIKLVNHILYQAVKRGASDIHIEPFEKEVQVRYRIDGVMYVTFKPPKRLQGAIISRLKIMANLNIAEKRLPQDGRINIKVGDKAIDIRVSVLPVAFGERVVMRLLDKSRTFKSLKDLGFSDHDYAIIEAKVHQPNGIILLTGPTGSGKTSTLYSILNELNTTEVNIITVEDPVEYQMNGVGQVQVIEKIGMTFAAALRSILRQDPDIVMIGETRDQETAQIAVQAALTGHLVLSTLHTNNAPASITRLIDMGVEPFLISSSVICIIAQRLVRKLCPNCKKKFTPSPAQLSTIGISTQEAAQITFYEPVGCSECNQTGFKGRLAVFEVMPMSGAIAKLTIAQADAREIREAAIKNGMTLLIQDGIRKIKEGLTTIDEILAVAVARDEEEPKSNGAHVSKAQ